MEPFWYNDFTVLYNPVYLTSFFPGQGLSYASQLNAVVRCAIYFTALLVLYNGSTKYLYVPAVALGVTYYLWQQSGKSAAGGKGKGGEEAFNGSATNNTLTPSFNNPFMNPNLIVHDPKTFLPKDNKVVRFDVNHHIDTNEDVATKAQVDDKFNARLYTSVGDVFTNENSQRQFYYVPSRTYPNDQDTFAKWCYGTSKSCKAGDAAACLQYNDELRGHANMQDITDPGPTQTPVQTNWF